MQKEVNSKNSVPLYLFHQGTNSKAYEYMGLRRAGDPEHPGMTCRVWAPNAQAVSLVGDFNNWDDEKHPLEKISENGVWEAILPFELEQYSVYKFCIVKQDGTKVLKSDPYAYHFETRPNNSSIYCDIEGFAWEDDAWFRHKAAKPHYSRPVNIYEVHAGSWRRYADGNVFSYDKLADELIPYLLDMGYTHVELMPLTEYPFDGSWGYQVTGYFAPTSRYGTPKDFMSFVNKFHKAGLGVIMDWVPAHFPKDEAGLARFDGTPCYEYADPRKGEHKDWGTLVFDYGRCEVVSFLVSSAVFWLEKYHIDGIRVDAVASMLYLDYSRRDGEWLPNKDGGKENLEAVAFLQRLNESVFSLFPEVMMIAEESTSWPMVSKPTDCGGLGFNYKWNMGWMHDFCEYMKLDPYFRKNDHYGMTFAMTYNNAENYILPLSHDEVVHLKCSMINKMPGLGFDKYANLKAGYAFMMCHPGKKLLFMGQEFAQLREWSEERELDWFLLAEPEHQAIQNWYRDLLHLYKKNKAMYELDTDPAGFEWVNADDIFRSIYSFIRHSKDNKKNLLVVCNFTPMERPDYRVGVPRRKQMKLVLNSDDVQYGGKGEPRPLLYKPVKQECDGQKYSFAYPLPAYGVAIFEF